MGNPSLPSQPSTPPQPSPSPVPSGIAKIGLETWSIIATVCMVAILSLLTWAAIGQKSVFLLAISAGGLGGIFHEIAQSGGKILFFRKEQDGFYLGGIAGVVLGAVAGVLVVKGHLVTGTLAPGDTMTQLFYDVFVAGLALKGVTEAASGNPVPQSGGSAAGPVITGINPANAAVGANVTISGTGFGSGKGSLTFNGLASTPLTWADATITAQIPAGTKSGPVVVTTAAGAASKGMNLTVS